MLKTTSVREVIQKAHIGQPSSNLTSDKNHPSVMADPEWENGYIPAYNFCNNQKQISD